MSAHRPHDCSRANAVLALYLDGDIGGGDAEESGFDFVCPETLAEHVGSCETCATALRRARRLDALLAEQAGEATARADAQDTTLDELLHSAIHRVQDAPAVESGSELGSESGIEADRPSPPAQHRDEHHSTRIPILSATLALLLVFTALLSGWTVLRPLATPDVQATVPGTSAVKTREATLPASPAMPPPAQPAEPDHGLLESGLLDPAGLIVLADGAIRSGPRTASRTRAASAETLLAHFEDAACPDEQRLAAAHELLRLRSSAHGHRRGLSDLCCSLASGRIAPALQAEVLHRAARSVTFTGHLHEALRRMESTRPTQGVRGTEDLGALVIATRIGDERLDQRVRRVVQRRPKLAETVASAVRSPVRSSGSAALLLAIWNDLQVRQRCDDDRTAQTLFAGQPSPVFAEVADELATCPSVPGRVRCLLALGWSGDRQFTTPLLARAAKGCRRETHAAAWALSQLPHAWLDDAVRRAASDRQAFVLRAALARARLPAASAWTDPLGLTRPEFTELVTASYDRFPRCAEWFRDGPTVPRAGALATED